MSFIGSYSFTESNRPRQKYTRKFEANPNKNVDIQFLYHRKPIKYKNGEVFIGNRKLESYEESYPKIMGLIKRRISQKRNSHKETKKNSKSAPHIATSIDLSSEFEDEPTREVLAHFSEHKMLAKIILMNESFELLVDELRTEIKSLINSIFSDNSQSGGDVGTCRDHQKSLEYQKPDTLHDFAKGRNGVFPYPFNGVNFYNEIMGTIFNGYTLPDKFEKYYTEGKKLGSFEDTIKNDYLTSVNYFGDGTCEAPYNKCSFYFTQKDKVLNDEFLKRYAVNHKIYDEDFTNVFKRDVTQGQGYRYYVLDACMSVQGDEVFNEMTRLDSLCTLFDPVGTTTFDPVKIRNTETKNGGIFIDNKAAYNLRLDFENNIATTGVASAPPLGSDPSHGDIYDCKFIDDEDKTEREGIYSITTKSFYDLAYNHLLNVNTLEKYGIIIKLRLCYFNQTVNIKLINGYKVCICVYTEPQHLDTDPLRTMPIRRTDANPIGPLTLKYVCAPLQSFSLHELALGMAYVHFLEKGAAPGVGFGSIDTAGKYIAPNGDDLSADLKKLIDVLRNLIEKSPTYSSQFAPNKLYYDLKLILMRLKAAGDHGSAESSRLIHKYCGNAKSQTMYLSGDQLCFVYSMMIGNATLFRYYAGSGKDKDANEAKVGNKRKPEKRKSSEDTKKDETCGVNDDCHECLTTVPAASHKKEHIHFLGFYNPGVDYTTLIPKIIKRCEAYIGEALLSDPPSGPPLGPPSDVLTNEDDMDVVSPTIEERISGFMNNPDLEAFESARPGLIREISAMLNDIRTNTTETNAETNYSIVGNIESMLHKLKFIEKRSTLADHFNKLIKSQRLDMNTNIRTFTNPQTNLKFSPDFSEFITQEHDYEKKKVVEDELITSGKTKKKNITVKKSVFGKLNAYREGVSKQIKKIMDKIKDTFGSEAMPIAIASLEHDINEHTLGEINKLIDKRIESDQNEIAKNFFKNYLLPTADTEVIPMAMATVTDPANDEEVLPQDKKGRIVVATPLRPSMRQGGKRKSKKARKGKTRKYKHKKRTTKKRHRKITKKHHYIS